jgi:bifunctional enzyme CysN/CysC
MDTPHPQLRLVIVGHVDHGKSTFVGRLFHDTGSLPEGKLEHLHAVAARRGADFEWANLMDALQAERDQNATIDTAQIWFRTPKREYVIIDAPGHKEFLKHMVTGAASADAALLLIDAQEGVQENSRRHGYLLHLLGVRQFAVLVNKMDLEDYRESRFRQVESEYAEWLSSFGVQPTSVIPISARTGANMVERSPLMSWWTGPTVIEALDAFSSSRAPVDKPLRFPIQDVYRFDRRRILAGRIESGRLRVGDTLLFSPSHRVSVVKSIETWGTSPPDSAEAGESIGITLAQQIFVERGAVASHENIPPYSLNRFNARVFWMGHEPLRIGPKYKLKLTTQEVEVWIESIERVIDASSLVEIHRPDPSYIGRYEVGELTIRARRTIAFDTFESMAESGRFVLVHGLEVSGGGVVIGDNYPRITAHGQHKSENIFWSTGRVTPNQRERRNGHKGRVVWLTGLSASGKSTIAAELERELFLQHKHVFILDGDNMRHGLCRDLGFNPADRHENIRRIGEVAKLFAEAGIICTTAFISPYRSDRDMVRAMLPPARFVEVFVDAPLAVCEKRDPKGLYARARAAEIKEFTGISAPYEAPLAPEIHLCTDQFDVQQCVRIIVDYLERLDDEPPAAAGTPAH